MHEPFCVYVQRQFQIGRRDTLQPSKNRNADLKELRAHQIPCRIRQKLELKLKNRDLRGVYATTDCM